MALGQSMKVLTARPPSRAGSLPQVFRRPPPDHSKQHTTPVARELAPAGLRSSPGSLRRLCTTVGASLLAIAVGRPMKVLTASPPSRASSLPQVFWRPPPDHSMQHTTPVARELAPAGLRSSPGSLRRLCTTVGASLLAIAVGRPMKVLTASPPSRASSLPQVFWRPPPDHSMQHTTPVARELAPAGLRSSPGSLRRLCTTVGASLLAIAVGQSMKVLTVSPPSRASSLPQVFPAPTH